LRTNRSPREAEVVKKLETLDRRTCEVFYDSASKPSEKASPFLLTAATTPVEGKEDDFNAWYEKEHLDLLRKVPGWIRTQRVKVIDSLKTSAGHDPIPNGAPKYVTVYEFENGDYIKTPEFEAAVSTPWANKVMTPDLVIEMRQWKLYRAWPNTAPKA